MECPRLLRSLLLASACAAPLRRAGCADPDGRRHRHLSRRDRPRSLSLARGCRRSRGAGLDARAERAHARPSRRGAEPRRRSRRGLTALITRGSPSFYALPRARRPRLRHAQRSDASSSRCWSRSMRRPIRPAARSCSIPNALDAGGTTTIDWYRPSPDGKLVAVSLSQRGSEIGTLHIYDTATGKEIGEPIPQVQAPTAGGSLAWIADGSGVLVHALSRRGAAGSRPAVLPAGLFPQARHRLAQRSAGARQQGRPAARRRDLSRPRQPARPDRRAGAERRRRRVRALRAEPATACVQLAGFEDKIVEVGVEPDRRDLCAVARRRAERQGPEAAAAVMTPFGAAPSARWSCRRAMSRSRLRDAIAVTRTHLLVRDTVGGPSQVRIFDHEGKPQGLLPLPEAAAIGEMAPLPDGGAHLFRAHLSAPALCRRAGTRRRGQSEETKFADTAAYSFDDVEVVREFAISKDGTKVPVNIIRKKGTVLDGTNPTILYGYGGYGISMRPGFLGARTRRVARRRRRLCDRQHPRRRRIRRALAPRRQPHEEAERVRRFRRGGAASDRAQIHRAGEARDLRRIERRPADGRDADAASGAVARRGLARRHLRHAARRARPQRRVQHHRIRHGEGRRRSSRRSTPIRPITTSRRARAIRRSC